MSDCTPYPVKRVIDGQEYTAQFNGMRTAIRCLDGCAEGEGVNLERYMQYVLSHVIVEPPGLTIDDFEDIDTLSEVVQFGREVMHGRFRSGKKKPGAAAAQGAG